MKSSRSKVVWAVVVVCAAFGLWFLGSNMVARAQQGPSPSAGETVYAPKKSAKAKVQQPQSQPSEQPQKVPKQPSQQAPQEKQPQKINPNNVYTLSTQSNLVNVDVLVTDKEGDPITGLKKGNFKVLDDGVPQTITNFSTAEAPITVALVLQYSNQWWGYLELALQDAYGFLNFMKPHDWVAVVYFDMEPHILVDFTHNRAKVRGALNSLTFPGFSESNIYDALNFTINRMKNIGGRKAIIPICTGIDSFSKLTYGQMLKIAKGSNTPIYPISILEWLTIRMGSDSITALQARNGLQSIARFSGGEAYFPRFEGALPDIYRQIAGQLRHEYSLGFIPTNYVKNGKYHKLKVELVDSEGNPLVITNKKGKKIKYRIVARQGYYATKGKG